MSDVRLNWIKQCVYELLNITDDAVFKEFLERDDEKCKEELLKYLSQTQDGSEIAMLFYRVRRQEEERIEVEITEPEPAESGHSSAPTVSDLSASLLTAELSDISAASSAVISEVKVKKGKGRKAKGSKKKAEEEAKRAAEEEAAAKAAAEAELQQLEDDQIKSQRTKTVIQKVWREYLYMVSGIDISFEIILRKKCVIFLRTQDGGIPEPREKDPSFVNRHMIKYFEITTLNNNGLTLLDDMLVEVYMPLLAYFEHRLSYISSTEAVERAPSDLKTADRVSSKSSEGKASASTGMVFTMLRDEFMHHLHKFKAAIGVVKNQLEERVNLVIPSSLRLDDPVEDILANVELMQQIEEVCNQWFRQVSSFFQIADYSVSQNLLSFFCCFFFGCP